MTKSLAELCLCPNVLWRIQVVSNEIRYLTAEVSKQSMGRVAQFLLNACNKMSVGKNNLKVEF